MNFQRAISTVREIVLHGSCQDTIRNSESPDLSAMKCLVERALKKVPVAVQRWTHRDKAPPCVLCACLC